MNLAIEHGDWISVHTSALWGGDFQSISFVRKFTNKPILAKGIHATDDDVKRALDHGADYVLVVDRVPMNWDWNDKCLFEFSFLNQFKSLMEIDYWHKQKHVYNYRHLKTGKSKNFNGINQYLGYKTKTNEKLWVCQASGIQKPEDVRNGVSAYIVGQNLTKFCLHKKHSI